MGEENTAENNSEEENVNDQEQQNDTGSDDNKNTEENDEDAGAGKDDGENNDGDQADKKDKEDDEPQIRASKQSNWKNRYFAEKRLANKKQDTDESDDEEDEIAPEDEEMVDKVIRKRFGSKFDQMDAQADKAELDSFITANPDFKPYQAKILKFWQHPSRNHLPIESVAYEVAGKDLIRIGAKRGKQADEKAKKEAGGGNSGASPGGAKKVADMTDEEFDAEVERVKRGRN